jgi:2-keto-4-pentenoate hydratase/2-oxohepta-3-ene-1,7-dioic acid hydratase in catechol pathway
MPFQLANYSVSGDEEDQAHAGVVIGGQRVIDLSKLLPGRADEGLQSVYKRWATIEPQIQMTLASSSSREAGVPVSSVRLLAPSLEPSSIYFQGFNYRDHVESMAQKLNLPRDPDPKTVGLPPWHSLKPRNSLCGMGDTVILPSPAVDWELELAVVIGKKARHVSVEDALDYVAGYTVALDLSARDKAIRPHTPVESPARMDWVAQKGFEGACPLGPWLTPASQVKDPQNLWMKLSVNDEAMQDSNSSNMIFTVADAISHLSTMVSLSPGDVLLTGTPAGTGAERGVFLKKGDVVKASIEGLGELVVNMA